MLVLQVEYSAINLAYAYATTSGVMRKAAILRHAAGRADRGMECAGGVEYQRARALCICVPVCACSQKGSLKCTDSVIV